MKKVPAVITQITGTPLINDNKELDQSFIDLESYIGQKFTKTTGQSKISWGNISDSVAIGRKESLDGKNGSS